MSLICIAIAVGIAFFLLPELYEKKAATMMVCLAATDITKGSIITEQALKTAEIGAYGLPTNVVIDKQLALGCYAAVDILAGDMLTANKMQEYKVAAVLDEIIEKELRLVTITFRSAAAGLAAHLQQGDVVQVVTYTESERIPVVLVYPELARVRVYDVENAKTQSVEDVRSNFNQSGSTYDPVPRTVTLIATDEQATRLVEAEYSGQIHLIFVSRGE